MPADPKEAAKRVSESTPIYTSSTRLAREVVQGIRNNVANGFSTLSPTTKADGSVTIRVKYASQAKMLTITITEDN